MDYKFLAKKELDRLFEETDLSVGEIVRSLVREKLTGLKSDNRGCLNNISDKEWYGVFGKVFLEESEDTKSTKDDIVKMLT